MRRKAASRSLAGVPAFEDVFERYFDDVCGFLCRRVGRELGEELTAETFAQAFRGWSGYDERRGEVRAWLFGIAINLVRAHRRSEGRRLRALARARGEATTSVDDVPLERLAARVETRRLAGALAKLRAGDRDVLLLAAWTELSSGEIAVALGIPAGTARSRLNRARRQVQAALADHDQASARPITGKEVIDG
jgi:RNA polymerase sigma-70 factor (ECF subfamily)